MSINIKCKKCGETGLRQDQDELARSNKCKVCGGILEIQKGSVMDVPIESLVKSGLQQAGKLIKKKQAESSKKIETTFEKMQTTLEAILEEQKKQTAILESLKGGSA